MWSRASRIFGGRVLTLCASVARKWTQRSASIRSAIFCALRPISPITDAAVTCVSIPSRIQSFEPRVILLQRRIALRMREDRRHPRQPQRVERLLERRRQRVVRQLHQQVLATVHRVTARVLERVAHVVVAEVEVAAGPEDEPDSRVGDRRAHLSEQCLVLLRVEGIAAVGVRCADDVGDAVIGGHARHLERGGEVRRPVVQPRQKMVVKVNHGLRVASSNCQCGRMLNAGT